MIPPKVRFTILALVAAGVLLHPIAFLRRLDNHFWHNRALRLEEAHCGRHLMQRCGDFSPGYEQREDESIVEFKARGLRWDAVHFGDSWCNRESCDQASAVVKSEPVPAPTELRQVNGWSVRFPNHARLVYDADTLTCYCEGSLQDAFDGVVRSMKSMQRRYERMIYGDKQIAEWDAETKGQFHWP